MKESKVKVERNVVVEFKDEKSELYENVDKVRVFKDRAGIEWLLITFFGNATSDNEHVNDETRKINIPVTNIRKFETIDDFEENLSAQRG